MRHKAHLNVTRLPLCVRRADLLRGLFATLACSAPPLKPQQPLTLTLPSLRDAGATCCAAA